jgi:hypothetical protein
LKILRKWFLVREKAIGKNLLRLAPEEAKDYDKRISRMFHEDEIVKGISKSEEMSMVIAVGLRMDRNRRLRQLARI